LDCFFQVQGHYPHKSEKGNINNANIIERVRVTPKPSKRKGNKINQISGYNNNIIRAIGQQSTSKMAMKNSNTLFLLLVLFIVSCVEDPQLSASETGPLPVGSWSNISYNENGMTLEKVNSLQENTYGYRFLSNGKFIHRANSGWCGTPPIVTSDFEGSWTKNSNVISIQGTFWGGETVEEWKIISSDNNVLTINVLKSELKMEE